MPEISRFFGFVVQMYYIPIMIRHTSTSGMPGKRLL